MKNSCYDRALSEVIGFVLLLGIIVAAVSLYSTYLIPASGREYEIAQMDSVGNQFTDYKLTVDALWSSRLINVNSPSPVLNVNPLIATTTLKLGTGGNSPLSRLYSPFLNPAPSVGTLAFNTTGDTLNIDSSSYHNSSGNRGEFPIRIASVEYSSNNYYWIQQRYSYQLGGVFLSQDEGTINRVSPLISITNAANRSIVVNIVPVQVYGNGSISSNNPVRLDILQKTVTPYNISSSSYYANSWVNLSVTSADPKTSAMWQQLFREIAIREQLDSLAYTTGTFYDPGTRRYTSFIQITGTNPDSNMNDVTLYVQRVEFDILMYSAGTATT
ncbi:hypothetical protein [Methanoregula sp.]|uniref:hypothetical protein n=1 Tax=Methanoregula sp. TaxID=2052170 RepID=UPI003569EEB2